jgi:hypothetical protein
MTSRAELPPFLSIFYLKSIKPLVESQINTPIKVDAKYTSRKLVITQFCFAEYISFKPSGPPPLNDVDGVLNYMKILYNCMAERKRKRTSRIPLSQIFGYCTQGDPGGGGILLRTTFMASTVYYSSHDK